MGSWKQKQYLIKEKSLIEEVNELTKMLDEKQSLCIETTYLIQNKQLELENVYSACKWYNL